MLLSDVFKNIHIENTKGTLDLDITNITSDSRNIKIGGLFFAIVGYIQDGTKYISSAIENGAIAIVIDADETNIQTLEIAENITIISVKNIRQAMSYASCNFFDNPSKKLKLIGVTGTKGKTSSTYMIKSILEKHGYKVGLMGSIATYIGDKQIQVSTRTTAESFQIQENLNLMVKENVDIAIIEVSSQAMKLHRVDGCDFDIALFTNLSEDHISPREHSDMEDYFNAKLALLKLAKTVVTNIDNEYSARVCALLPDKNVITFALKNQADIMASNLQKSNSYVDFILFMDNVESKVRISIPGEYMVYNALGAIAVAREFNVTPENINSALSHFSVFGRSELVPNKLGLTIMIDYAHTPSSLQSILETVKPYTKGRVICTWGVGGDRDKAKRPIMGEISGTLADYTILTSDQVRTEDPMTILKEIEIGLKKVNADYTIILNRTEALRYALSITKKDDILVIPGLGSDLYIEYMRVKYPYNEREVIHDIIEEMTSDSDKITPFKTTNSVF